MKPIPKIDIALIGGGIMSATLGVFLKSLMPHSSIYIFERLELVADESSSAWNNAGTGHSGFCELNYTPITSNGIVNISKAVNICSQFELSKEFWAFAVENKLFSNDFISPVPHHSFVTEENDVEFLFKRYQALSDHHLFRNMGFTSDIKELKAWVPLMMQSRNLDEPIAATKMNLGTDVNFGKLTQNLFSYLKAQENTALFLHHQVLDIDRSGDLWELEVENLLLKEKIFINANFVFVGAGGGALRLLNKARIDEIDGFGGFPIGGKWLWCKNEKVIAQHRAKVYGKAKIGTPPMSVPHLDTRFINGKRELLFGPYAGFSTKFLKHGSGLDFPESIDFDNMLPIIETGLHNIPLTRYLIDQVRMTFEEKMIGLKEYYPSAQAEDWELVVAGQRVQVIKKDEYGHGVLEFGTELIYTNDHTLAGLLGASPGASTAVAIMLDLLKKCFPEQLQSKEWKETLELLVPGFYQNIPENEEYLIKSRARTSSILGLS